MRFLSTTLSLLLPLFSLSYAFNYDLRIGSGGRTLHDFRKLMASLPAAEETYKRDGFPTHFAHFPVDHFHDQAEYEPHSSKNFTNRYWFDASHYKPGGPVILLIVGEATGIERLPILQDGILKQFIVENDGIGVVLEHRYYGASFPTPDLSIENLRFLTTEQAMADAAYLAQNIQFPGLEKYGDLTSKTTPWITYGGSYAGAFSAFLRKQYPDVFWGSISSSGVVEDTNSPLQAIYDYWEYYAPIAQYGPSECIAAQKLFINMTDTIYNKNDAKLTMKLQELFGLPNITHFNDFASQLGSGIAGWQDLIWNPAISYDEFYWYCGNVSSHKVLFPHTESKRAAAESMLAEGGYKNPNKTIVNQLLNNIGWTEESIVKPCAAEGLTQDQCFTTHNSTYYQQDSIDQYSWRSWSYQYCSQWGFLQTGSGVPADQMPIISRTITLEYTSIVCRDAFNITKPSDVQKSLQYGGYNISSPRLAIIDGEWDPWRPATPHAFQYGAQHRNSTTNEPFILIPRSIHHWDEYGVPPKNVTKDFPPQRIQATQKMEHEFVAEWLKEWKEAHPKA